MGTFCGKTRLCLAVRHEPQPSKFPETKQEAEEKEKFEEPETQPQTTDLNNKLSEVADYFKEAETQAERSLSTYGPFTLNPLLLLKSSQLAGNLPASPGKTCPLAGIELLGYSIFGWPKDMKHESNFPKNWGETA